MMKNQVIRLRFMVDIGILCTFFCAPPCNSILSNERWEIEKILQQLESFLEEDILRLCITDKGVTQLCSYFRGEDKKKLVSILEENFEVLPVSENHCQAAQDLGWKDTDAAVTYVTACFNKIPIILTSISLNFEISKLSPTRVRVYSPREILTLCRLGECLPLLDPVFKRRIYRVLSMIPVSRSRTDYLALIQDWIAGGQSRVVTPVSMPLLMQVYHDPTLASKLANFVNLMTPAGKPLLWLLKLMGANNQEQLKDVQLVRGVFDCCEKTRSPTVFVVGYRFEHLTDSLRDYIENRFPHIHLVGIEDAHMLNHGELVHKIKQSKARVTFISMPSPLRENFMVRYHTDIKTVLIGLNTTAFPILLGYMKPAPKLFQTVGLEWCCHVLHNPREFWEPYCRYVPEFIALALRRQFFRSNNFNSHLISLPKNPDVIDLLYHIVYPQ